MEVHVPAPSPEADAPQLDAALREDAGGVTTLFMNRPERHNAWTRDMERRLFDLMDESDRDPTVRAVVLTGSGTAFCPGLDIDALQISSQQPEPVDSSWRTRPMTHARSLRKPTIAAINGACAGIGLVQALSCDVRMAAAGAKIAPAFTRRGLPAEFGVSWLLTRLIGAARATELLVSSRTIAAEEALEIGLVNRVLPAEALLSSAQDYALDLARNCSPRAMAAVKDQLNADWARDLAASAEDARRRVADPELRRDFQEGVASYVERREPRFGSMP
jgi:enoyl-CoA hydratase/carnithine racemase